MYFDRQKYISRFISLFHIPKIPWNAHIDCIEVCICNVMQILKFSSGSVLEYIFRYELKLKLESRFYFISYILFDSKQSLEYPKIKIRIIRILRIIELPQNHYQDYIRLFFRNKFEFFLQYQQGRWLARFAGSLEPARSNKSPGFFIIRDT